MAKRKSQKSEQVTSKGLEIPIPRRSDVVGNLRKAAQPKGSATTRGAVEDKPKEG
jgi:hypothetical protein